MLNPLLDERSGEDRRSHYRGGRRADDPPVPMHELTTRQRQIVEIIDRYHWATEEPCPARLVARRLRVHISTVRGHLEELHRKGWIKAPGGPCELRQAITPR